MEIQNTFTDESVLQELGSRIKQLRIERSLTQAKLAEKANISLSTVVRLEGGNSVQMESFIRLLRSLRLLNKFNVVLPEQELHPVELLHTKIKKKQRVSSKHKKKPAVTAWKWGDEQ